jgi:hypothetical protein
MIGMLSKKVYTKNNKFLKIFYGKFPGAFGDDLICQKKLLKLISINFYITLAGISFQKNLPTIFDHYINY